MPKKRILFVGEASYIATGFGTYWNEVIKRLHAKGEFEIAELGSYAHDGDPKIQQVPWKFYPVMPNPNDKEGKKAYESKHTNQFGEWRFNDICLEFKPDIVIDHRDFWMSEFILRSPLRRNFKCIYMPTIDGIPQRDLWLDWYKLADGVLTYSEWGMDVLKKEGREGTNLLAVASPGADIEVFCPPENKGEQKRKIGIDDKMIIVGTIMRNQKRKLYYDLIEAFAGWVHQSKSKGHTDLVKKTFLYLHTSYPDVGYDIGRAIKEFKMGNKVLMTYLCTKCHTAFPSFFIGDLGHCRKCGNFSAQPPNASHQCPRSVLADIIKCFDLYVQYSICEGWGMPLTEAMACGVPIMAVNYSAMEDHLQTPGSIPINIERFFYEAIIETEQRRALPDNKDFQKKLDRFLKLSPEKKVALGQQAREYVLEPTEVYGQEEKLPRWGWEKAAAIWNNVLENCEIKDRSTTWESKESRTHNPNITPPSHVMNNTEFVRWVIGDVWNRPEYAHTQFAGEWARYLQQGFMLQGGRQIRVDRNYVLQYFYNIVMEENKVEQKRLNMIQEKDPQQIDILVT